MRDALDELRQHVKHRDYEAFRLRWIEGWSVNEIAAASGDDRGADLVQPSQDAGQASAAAGAAPRIED